MVETPVTAHELASMLLKLPDLPVVVRGRMATLVEIDPPKVESGEPCQRKKHSYDPDYRGHGSAKLVSLRGRVV